MPRKASTTKPATRRTRKPKQTAEINGRPVLYPEPLLRLCHGDTSLTDDQAKELMGWQEEPEGKSFGEDYLLKDLEGTKIRCCHNDRNRPLDMSKVRTLMSEILFGNWNLNLENLIIGKTGLVISAQHRLIALILACQEWERDPDKYPHWISKPTLETAIAYGCSEESKVVNTIDTGTSRTLADALFISDNFRDKPAKDRKKLAKVAEFAIRYVWDRTGVQDAHGISKTNLQFTQFLDRHPTLLKCVSHIYEEDGTEKRVTRYVTPGTAAGMMYLMACSRTNPVDYIKAGDESAHDWTLLDQAEEFWTLLANGSSELSAVGETLKKIAEPNEFGISNPPTRAEKLAVIVKAWERFSEEQDVSLADLRLSYTRDSEIPVVTDSVSVGGIDVKDDPDAIDPKIALQEIESEKQAIKDEARKGQPKKGDRNVWVKDEENGCHWQGTVTEVKQDTTFVKPNKGYAGSDNNKPFPVPTVSVQFNKP